MSPSNRRDRKLVIEWIEVFATVIEDSKRANKISGIWCALSGINGFAKARNDADLITLTEQAMDAALERYWTLRERIDLAKWIAPAHEKHMAAKRKARAKMPMKTGGENP